MNLKKKFVIGAASVALVAGMGGVAAPAAVATDIANPGFVNKLVRLGGMDRVSTSLKVAAYEFGSRVEKTDPRGARPEVLYVTSYADGNLVDAASAGMLTDGPIAFVSNNSYVAEAVGKFFADTKTNSGFAAIKKVVAIGGEGAVSDATLKAVAKQLGANVTTGRLGGKDRYETSVAIAEHIYSQALLKDNYYKDRAKQRIVNPATSNLGRVYLANGADSHVVDSMVAGTLDNGPVLLVQPDGKIPEVAAEFIKKALPEQFAALGGAETVSDATVQEAWLIKTLANKWDTSSEIPDLYKNAKNLRNLVYGVGKKNKREVPSENFMGLKRIVADADAIYRDWNGKADAQKGIINAATNRLAHANTKFGTKTAGFYHDVLNGTALATDAKAIHDALIKLYGDLITTTAGGTAIDSSKVTIASFMTDSSGADGDEAKYAVASGFNFAEIEGSTDYRQAVKVGTDDLDNGWSATVNPVLGTQVKTKAAQASQYMVADNTINNSLDVPGSDSAVSGAVITDLAKYVLDSEKSWLDQYKKQLETVEQGLRLEQDKIAPKTELRLGGKDRFETAQLIANQYGNLYGGVIGLPGHFTEAYVANGTRLPDSLTAGQLSRGPILLVRAEGDLPEFTVTVAKKLKSWTNADHLIAIAIGETGVLPDEQFKKVADLINGGKELPLVGSKKDLAVATVAYATPTATETVSTSAPAKSAAVTADALTWTTPSTAPTGATYTLKSATPDFEAATAAPGVTPAAATFGSGATVDAAGKLSIPASDANLVAANKGTYTWTVTVKAPGYEDKDVTYVLTVN